MKYTLVALAVLGLGASAVHAQEVIKLGAAAPLTGTQSHLGKDIENGVRLAIEDYNAKGVTLGGKKVKFEVKNDGKKDQEVEGIDGTKLEELLIPSGKTRSINYTAPKEAGEQKVKCYAPGGASTIVTINVK